MRNFKQLLKLPTAKFFLAVAVLISICAECSVSTAKLSDVRVCSSVNSDKECESEVSTFQTTVPVIYCTAELRNAPKNTKVTFTWRDESEVIGTADVETGSNVIYSTYKSPGYLKPGKYSVTVKIHADNSDPVKKDFTIE